MAAFEPRPDGALSTAAPSKAGCTVFLREDAPPSRHPPQRRLGHPTASRRTARGTGQPFGVPRALRMGASCADAPVPLPTERAPLLLPLAEIKWEL